MWALHLCESVSVQVYYSRPCSHRQVMRALCVFITLHQTTESHWGLLAGGMQSNQIKELRYMVPQVSRSADWTNKPLWEHEHTHSCITKLTHRHRTYSTYSIKTTHNDEVLKLLAFSSIDFKCFIGLVKHTPESRYWDQQRGGWSAASLVRLQTKPKERVDVSRWGCLNGGGSTSSSIWRHL